PPHPRTVAVRPEEVLARDGQGDGRRRCLLGAAGHRVDLEIGGASGDLVHRRRAARRQGRPPAAGPPPPRYRHAPPHRLPPLLRRALVMPKRNGYDTLRGLRREERTKQAHVVAVSSKNQESDRAWGLRQGADDYLPKPFSADHLLTTIRRFVR